MNKIYICECGKEFNNKQAYCGHCGRCKIHLGHEPIRIGRRKGCIPWNKGLTKETSEIVARISEFNSKRMTELGENNPWIIYSHNKPKSHYEHQSATRKAKYASGELTPSRRAGRGKYSYLVYSDKKILLRSTYEFIYALYLLDNNISFEYENIRATYDNHTYICDFNIGNKIIEVKGIRSFDETKPRAAFESLGYEYEVIYGDKINKIKSELSSKYNMDDILNKIIEGHNKRDYYVFNYDDY